MVGKEEIYCWFRGSTSAERIDVICNLLHLCVPFELRFLGSCLEDLARKEHLLLRDYELRANDVDAYSALDCLTDASKRIDHTLLHTLGVYTSLLASTNVRCAGKVFELATRLCDRLQTRIASDSMAWVMDSGLVGDLVLLLTMASLHPAFVFVQRVRLYELLTEVRREMCDCGGQELVSDESVAKRDDIVQPLSARDRLTQYPEHELLANGTSSPRRSSYDRRLDSLPLDVSSLGAVDVARITDDAAQHSSSDSVSIYAEEHDYVNAPGMDACSITNSRSLDGRASLNRVNRLASCSTSDVRNEVKFHQVSPPVRSSRSSPSLAVRDVRRCRQSSPRSPNCADDSIGVWLKDVRLHKYTASLAKYTWEELVTLTDGDLQLEGLTSGACRKFHTELEALLRIAQQQCSQSLSDIVLSNRPRPLLSQSNWSIVSPSPVLGCGGVRGVAGTLSIAAAAVLTPPISSPCSMDSSCSEYSTPPGSPDLSRGAAGGGGAYLGGSARQRRAGSKEGSRRGQPWSGVAESQRSPRTPLSSPRCQDHRTAPGATSPSPPRGTRHGSLGLHAGAMENGEIHPESVSVQAVHAASSSQPLHHAPQHAPLQIQYGFCPLPPLQFNGGTALRWHSPPAQPPLSASIIGGRPSRPYYNLPPGSVPVCFMPAGSMPAGCLPAGSMPGGSVPAGSVPANSAGFMPAGSIPTGFMPAGSFPDDLLHNAVTPPSQSNLALPSVHDHAIAVNGVLRLGDGETIDAGELARVTRLPIQRHASESTGVVLQQAIDGRHAGVTPPSEEVPVRSRESTPPLRLPTPPLMLSTPPLAAHRAFGSSSSLLVYADPSAGCPDVADDGEVSQAYNATSEVVGRSVAVSFMHRPPPPLQAMNPSSNYLPRWKVPDGLDPGMVGFSENWSADQSSLPTMYNGMMPGYAFYQPPMFVGPGGPQWSYQPRFVPPTQYIGPPVNACAFQPPTQHMMSQMRPPSMPQRREQFFPHGGPPPMHHVPHAIPPMLAQTHEDGEGRFSPPLCAKCSQLLPLAHAALRDNAPFARTMSVYAPTCVAQFSTQNGAPNALRVSSPVVMEIVPNGFGPDKRHLAICAGCRQAIPSCNGLPPQTFSQNRVAQMVKGCSNCGSGSHTMLGCSKEPADLLQAAGQFHLNMTTRAEED